MKENIDSPNNNYHSDNKQNHNYNQTNSLTTFLLATVITNGFDVYIYI